MTGSVSNKWSKGTGGPSGDEVQNLVAHSLRSKANMAHREDVDTLVVGTLSCNAGPRSHDAGNFHCNQGVDAGHIIPVQETHGCLTPWDCETKRIHGADGVMATLAGSDGKGGQRMPYIAHTLKGEGFDGSEDGTGRVTPLVCGAIHSGHPSRDASDAVNGHLIAFNSREDCISSDERFGALGGSSPQAQAIAFTERTRKDGRTFECQEDIAYALTNPGSGGRTHSRQLMQGMAVRRLTPLECERLQGFPDLWTTGQKDSPRYRQIGNAVAVPNVEWIARRIAKMEYSTGALHGAIGGVRG